MIVTFWGVRGSIPTPGPHTLRYGGNTACISVEIGRKVLVIDAGTGIRPLGKKLLETDKEIFLLLTHLHIDHLVGFPFFDPLYEAARVIHLLDYQAEGDPWTPLNLLDGVHSPIVPAYLACSCVRVEEEGLAYLRRHGFPIQRLSVNHPGGAYGYRLEHAGRTVVHIPDNELEATEGTTSFEAFSTFCREADVLCHDAQYLDDEMPTRRGWGHSTVRRACDLALAANVKHLVLFHHDPQRSDDELDAIQKEARARLTPYGIACTVAYEGLQLDLTASDQRGPSTLHRMKGS